MKNGTAVLSAAYLRRLIPAAIFCGAAALSVWTRFQPGIHAARTLGEFVLEMAAFLPLMFVLIGLFDVCLLYTSPSPRDS